MSSKKRYPPRFPRSASGIRLQGVRRTADRSWWAERWADFVESACIPVRLGMGRRYASSGQVLSISIDGSYVDAEVLGVRPDAYRVKLSFARPSAAAHRKIAAAFAAKPILAARLLAGEMPMEAEEIFRREKSFLFPGGKVAPGKYDVVFSCSCPDWCNPCKHVAAALLLLGEEIARRPRTLLELRGFSTEELSA